MAEIELWIVVVVAMTIAIACFSSVILLSRRSERKDQYVFLAGFLLLYAAIKIDQLHILTGNYALLPHLTGFTYAAKLFLPSAMYFYARALTSPDVKWLSRRDWPALIMPFIATIVALPYYLLSAEQKIALMDPATRDADLYERALLGCQLGLVLFVITALVYLTFSFRSFRAHTSRLRMLFSRIDDKEIDWLRWVLLVLTFGWVWYGLSELWLLTGTQPRSAYFATVVFEFLWISAIALRGVNQLPVYQPDSLPESLIAPGGSKTQPEQYARSGLSTTDRNRIAAKLRIAMESDGLYREPDLSLRMLSERLGVSDINLSETFSAGLNTSFFDFVNGYRIAHACKLLSETNDKVLAVAFDSGFNSRSTFSTAFKKHVGTTPSEYRKGN